MKRSGIHSLIDRRHGDKALKFDVWCDIRYWTPIPPTKPICPKQNLVPSRMWGGSITREYSLRKISLLAMLGPVREGPKEYELVSRSDRVSSLTIEQEGVLRYAASSGSLWQVYYWNWTYKDGSDSRPSHGFTWPLPETKTLATTQQNLLAYENIEEIIKLAHNLD